MSAEDSLPRAMFSNETRTDPNSTPIPIQELITCLELKNICAHNNYAERLLRDNVILRKITLGNRSEKGIQNHQVLMSLIQTARLRLLNPLDFLHSLLTRTDCATASLFPSLSTSAG